MIRFNRANSSKIKAGSQTFFGFGKPLCAAVVVGGEGKQERMMSFSRILMVSAVAAGTLATASIGMTAPASAGNGGAIAAGVVGGLALGAIAGSAAANAQPGYGYGYGYPAYAAPAPAYGGCYFTRQATYDPYGNFAGYRRVRVCE